MIEPIKSELFKNLYLELEKYYQFIQSQAKLDILSFPSFAIEQLGQALFSNLEKGGFCTQIVSAQSSWDPRSHYFEAARNAARRGCLIERAFLLPHRYAIHDSTLREHYQLDKNAGITTRILYVGELLSNLKIPFFESLDFGLWDNNVLCNVIHHNNGITSGPVEWKITCRREDIQNAQEYIKIIGEMSQELEINLDSYSRNEETNQLDLEEPMITTAPIANFLSEVVCKGGYMSKEDCSWYHSVWQYLRIFNMVSTPTWHANFYKDALGNLAKTGSYQRTLVSGTADYSMLAHLIWSYRLQNVEPKVTVLDLCETPLLLCKWYAKLISGDVDTYVGSIFEHDPPDKYDLIVTDAFLTRFTSSERISVVNKWSSLLRSNGCIVTTLRIEPSMTEECVKTTSLQSDAFRRRALQEATRWQDFLDKSPEEIANKSQRYAERMVSYSIKSIEEIEKLFIENNFKIDEIKTSIVPGEMSSTMYAEVIAKRI